jgi:hypothetical protein
MDQKQAPAVLTVQRERGRGLVSHDWLIVLASSVFFQNDGQEGAVPLLH